jgi:hypothetical protein
MEENVIVLKKDEKGKHQYIDKLFFTDRHLIITTN